MTFGFIFDTMLFYYRETIMLSLYSWAKRENLAYSTATKMFINGELEGAIKEGRSTSVPENTKPPFRQTIECEICKKAFPQITGTHLKSHSITLQEYKNQFPNALIVSDEVSNAISEQASGRIRTDEHKANLSASLQGKHLGKTPWNKGQIGMLSDETIQKMSESQTGRTHSEETKQKIGDGNRGKIISVENIEKARNGLLDYYSKRIENGFFHGRNHSEETKQKIGENTKNAFANMSPEKIAAAAELRAKKTRGQKRTDEQKERYSIARVKYMSENASKLKNTKGEITIKTWLEERNIEYKQQYLIEGSRHPYDFYVPSHNTIIEYDGAHHWIGPWWNISGKSEEERAEMLEKQKSKDIKETMIAEQAGYKVIRLRGRNNVGDHKDCETFEQQIAKMVAIIR